MACTVTCYHLTCAAIFASCWQVDISIGDLFACCSVQVKDPLNVCSTVTRKEQNQARLQQHQYFSIISCCYIVILKSASLVSEIFTRGVGQGRQLGSEWDQKRNKVSGWAQTEGDGEEMEKRSERNLGDEWNNKDAEEEVGRGKDGEGKH